MVLRRASMRRSAASTATGIAGGVEEGKSIMEEDFDDTTMDACLIAAGSARRALRDGGGRHAGGVGSGDGPRRGSRFAPEILDEEKAADEKLSSSLRKPALNQGDGSQATIHTGMKKRSASCLRRVSKSPQKAGLHYSELFL